MERALLNMLPSDHSQTSELVSKDFVNPPNQTESGDDSLGSTEQAGHADEPREIIKDEHGAAASGNIAPKEDGFESAAHEPTFEEESLTSIFTNYLTSSVRVTAENIASKPYGQVVFRTTDCALHLVERMVVWTVDSSSLKYIPWLIMLPFLMSVRIVNIFLSSAEKITGFPMPTQTRMVETIRNLRYDISLVRSVGRKNIEMEKNDKGADKDLLNVQDDSEKMTENATELDDTKINPAEPNLNEGEGTSTLQTDENLQMGNQTSDSSSTLEENSGSDSDLGHKIEEILSTVSTNLDDSNAEDSMLVSPGSPLEYTEANSIYYSIDSAEHAALLAGGETPRNKLAVEKYKAPVSMSYTSTASTSMDNMQPNTREFLNFFGIRRSKSAAVTDVPDEV